MLADTASSSSSSSSSDDSSSSSAPSSPDQKLALSDARRKLARPSSSKKVERFLQNEVMEIHAVMTDDEESQPPPTRLKKKTKNNDWWKNETVVKSKFLRQKFSQTANAYEKKIKILTYNNAKKEAIIDEQKKLIFKLKKKNRSKKIQILKLCEISDSDWYSFCFAHTALVFFEMYHYYCRYVCSFVKINYVVPWITDCRESTECVMFWERGFGIFQWATETTWCLTGLL